MSIIDAAKAGDLDEVRRLVATGADVHTRAEDIAGYTALMMASGRGHTELVRFLLDRGADIDARTLGTRATALMMASEKGHAEVVRFLLDRGADIDARTFGTMETALMMASENGHTEADDWSPVC
jgi:uncharacterized protein